MRLLWLKHFDQVNGSLKTMVTQAVLSAIEKSSLNAFSYIDKEVLCFALKTQTYLYL